MQQLRPCLNPRFSRRARDRGVRIAAAALIAAALAETSGARPAGAGWTPGNPSLPGTYYADQPLDINGDGFTDFVLHAGGYGSVTLGPLTVDGVNNQIFISSPGTVLPFTNPDDMLTAGAPTVVAPSQGNLYQFYNNRKFAGVIFHVPASSTRGNRTTAGSDDYGYVEISTGLPGATIYSTGYQPLGSTAVDPGSPTAFDFLLDPAAPNPARLGARLGFTLSRAGGASLELLDLQGRLVRNLASGTFTAGEHHIVWDGRDDAGKIAPSGLYFLRLEAEARRLVGKLVVSH